VVGLEISARNQMKGKVLDIEKKDKVMAIIKATEVMIGKE